LPTAVRTVHRPYLLTNLTRRQHIPLLGDDKRGGDTTSRRPTGNEAVEFKPPHPPVAFQLVLSGSGAIWQCPDLVAMYHGGRIRPWYGASTEALCWHGAGRQGTGRSER